MAATTGRIRCAPAVATGSATGAASVRTASAAVRSSAVCRSAAASPANRAIRPAAGIPPACSAAAILVCARGSAPSCAAPAACLDAPSRQFRPADLAGRYRLCRCFTDSRRRYLLLLPPHSRQWRRFRIGGENIRGHPVKRRGHAERGEPLSEICRNRRRPDDYRG